MLLFVISILALTNNLPGQNSRNPEKHQTKGQVEKWVQLLENGQSNPFSRWILAKELKRFTRKLLTNAEDLHLSQNELNNMELPDEIRAFFDASQPSSDQEQFGQPSENALDLDPEIVIQYLEEKVNV